MLENQLEKAQFLRRNAAIVMTLLLIAVAVGPVSAQMMPKSTSSEAAEPAAVDLSAADLTPEERLALIARMNDSQIRDILIQQVGAAETADSGSTDVIDSLGDQVHAVRGNLRKTLAEFVNLPSVIPFAVDRLTAGRGPSHLWLVLLGLAAMFVVGAFVEWLFRRATARFLQRDDDVGDAEIGAKIGFLSMRAVLDAVALVIFAVAAIAVFFILYQGHEPTRALVMSSLSVVLIVRGASVFSRFLLAPKATRYRILPIDDDDAGYVHKCALWFAGIAAFALLISSLMLLIGVETSLFNLILLLVGVIAIVVLLAMIWRGRGLVRKYVEVPSDGVTAPILRLAVDTWHIFAMIYVLGLFLVINFFRLAGEPVASGVGIVSLLVVIGLPLVDAAIRRLLSGKPSDEQDEVGPYRQVLVRTARILLVLSAVVLLTRMWGADLFSLAQQGIGASFSRAILDVAFTVLVAYVGWQLAKTAIDRQIQVESGDEEGQEADAEGGAGASRLRTLLPLFRRFLQITIITMMVMIVLSSLGVDIGPLIAGAGIIGLAIGFGAQTLVKDIVSGVFFLVDDAFRLGEYIDIGSVKGSVEKINVRSFVLRHHRGPLHTVPFGEIQFLTNYSRDWVILKLEFRVTYDTNINKVKKIFKKIGADLMEHEELGPFFLEPLKSQGVKAMEDSAIIVRAKFTAKPGKQFQIRKEVYSRVQQAFQENGIHFAHRRVAIDLPPGFDQSAPENRPVVEAAGAAAAASEDIAKAGAKAG